MTAELKSLTAELDDVKIVAVTIWGEARSEAVDGQIAVGNVIRNRLGEKWPDYRAVCLAKAQFSCWWAFGGAGNYLAVTKLVERLAKGTAVTTQPYKQCAFVAYGIVNDYLKDNTKQARHYHTAALTPRPNWAVGHLPVVQRGRHVFYNDVR